MLKVRICILNHSVFPSYGLVSFQIDKDHFWIFFENLPRYILDEIVETEKNYVQDLKFIIEAYKLPLQRNRILTRAEVDTMFVNLDEIIQVNTKFLK